MRVNQTMESPKTLYNFEKMWKTISAGIILGLTLIMLYEIFAQRNSFEQKRPDVSRQDSNPYSKLDEKELTEKTKAVVNGLRAFNEDFRKAISGGSTKNGDFDSNLKHVGTIQSEYDKKFAGPVRDLEKELLRRLPKGAAPKDAPSEIASSLIKSGRLAGADPAQMIATYLEQLLARLPHVNVR